MNVNFFIKLKIIYFFLIIINFNSAHSEILNEINVIGNERLAKETVLMFSELVPGKDVNQNDLNLSIKKLYKTNYFKNIQMILNNNILEIKIIENPIIQTIKIKGIKNKTILESLKRITKKINTKVIENENNSVDVVYIFNLGKRAIIKKINFIGNKIFKDSKLRNVIKSEEGRFWKIISSDKYLNEQKVKLDESLLFKYFKNKGYYNVKIKSSYAKIIGNKFFELNFNIDAGNKYYFNDITMKIDTDFSDENFTKLDKIFKNLKGKKYSINSLNKILNEIDSIALEKEFVFINAKYEEKVLDNNKIDIEFLFEDLEKFYVEQINIFGNFITE